MASGTGGFRMGDVWGKGARWNWVLQTETGASVGRRARTQQGFFFFLSQSSFCPGHGPLHLP